jgi:hypothetical protein
LGRGKFGEREREKKGGVGGLVFDVFGDMAVPAILVAAWQANWGVKEGHNAIDNIQQRQQKGERGWQQGSPCYFDC